MLKFYDIAEDYVKYLQTINLFVVLFLRLKGSSIMRPYHTL